MPERPTKQSTRAIHRVLAGVLLLTTNNLFSQTLPTDFFDDMSMPLVILPPGLQGNANWTIFDTSLINPDGSLKETPDPWGPAMVDTSADALRMQSTNPVDVADPDVFPHGVRTVFPVVNAGLTNAAWNPSLVAPVADVTVRTRVNVGSASQQSILLRANGPEGYALTASGATNDFALARFDGGIQSRVEFTEGLDFQVGEDWMLEASAIGDQISLKAWPHGTSVPLEPQIQWTDVTYPGGVFFLTVPCGRT